MRAWIFILGGLIVWTVHFFGLYVLASVFPDMAIARVLAGFLTLACLGLDGFLLWRAARILQSGDVEEVRHWKALIATLAAAISSVAVVWQGFPALLA